MNFTGKKILNFEVLSIEGVSGTDVGDFECGGVI